MKSFYLEEKDVFEKKKIKNIDFLFEKKKLSFETKQFFYLVSFFLNMFFFFWKKSFTSGA